MKLSVLVPVYNEANTITRALTRLQKKLDHTTLRIDSKKVKLKYEIIIINDGSTDATISHLAKFRRTKRFKVIHLPKNRGKGFAIRTGIKQATGDIFLIQDADLEYHPKYIPSLIKPFITSPTQAVYGSRLKHLPLTLENISTIPLPTHFIANKILSFFTNVLYGSHLTDMETGYKLFTRSAITPINLHSNGFEIEVELTAKLLLSGVDIHEVAITTKPRTIAEGKKITFHDGLMAIYSLVKFRFFS